MTPAPQTEDLIAQLEALIDKVTPGDRAWNANDLFVPGKGVTLFRGVTIWNAIASDRDWLVLCSPANLRTLLDALSARSREVERLRSALKPFGEYMVGGMDLDNMGSPLPDSQGVGWIYLTHADFRRARQALEAPHE